AAPEADEAGAVLLVVADLDPLEPGLFQLAGQVGELRRLEQRALVLDAGEEGQADRLGRIAARGQPAELALEALDLLEEMGEAGAGQPRRRCLPFMAVAPVPAAVTVSRRALPGAVRRHQAELPGVLDALDQEGLVLAIILEV